MQEVFFFSFLDVVRSLVDFFYPKEKCHLANVKSLPCAIITFDEVVTFIITRR